MTTEEIKEDICRLCLKFGNDTFSDFSDLSSKEKLKNILPELNVNNPSDFVICTRCKTSLEGACQFAQTFSQNDEFIRKEKKYLKIVNAINLNRIVKNSGRVVKKDMNEYVCRICLKSKVGKYTNLNKLYTDKYFSNVLESCLSKLDKQLTLNPVICEICQKKLREIYSFKLDCMIVEKKVLEYSGKSSVKEVDLNSILDFLNAQKQDLVGKVMAIEDGVSTQTSTQNSQTADTNKKRSLSDGESNVVPQKKKKSSDNENTTKMGATPKSVQDDTLPRFRFGYNLIHDPRNVCELEEWLMKVDTLKKKNNWTDLLTINKVLERLEGMTEIHTWLKNISTIFKWEEWRNKLVKVFPAHNDYYSLLRKMRNRKKKPSETFVDYYNMKMERLNAINVTGESAVSCLLGGLTDNVIACVGRAGNYKNPEQLLPYFKTCDDKEETNKSVETLKKRKKKCHLCNKRSHSAGDCPNLGNLNDPRSKIVEERAAEMRNILHTKHQNGERGKDIIKRPENHKAIAKPLNSSAHTQKQSEQISTSITSQDSANRDESNIKPQENVASISTKTSTALLLNQSKETNVVTKQDHNDRIEKQSKQSDKDACFVKPQPPSRKSTSSGKLQSKVSDLNKPHIQKVVSAGGISSAKQSEGSAAQKPQNKENSPNEHTSSVKTQSQSKKGTLNRGESSTSSKPHNELGKKGATRQEQKKEENNSSKHRSKLQDRSEKRRTPQSKENKINVHASSGKTQSQGKESSLNRDASGTRSTGDNETSKIGTSAAKIQERKKEGNLNERRSRSQDGNEKRSIQSKGVNFVKSQTPAGRGNTNRGTFAKSQRARDDKRRRFDSKKETYSNKRTSAASSEGWKEDTYSTRRESSDRSQRDTDRNYFNRDTYGAAKQDRGEWSYPDSVRSTTSERNYLDRGISDGRSQWQYEESIVNRARSTIRPDMEGYTVRDLSSEGFQERGDSSVRINEREMCFTQRRPQEIVGYINQSISYDRWGEEEEERRGGYENSRSPMQGEIVNIVNRGSVNSRLQEIEVDTVNQNIFNNRSREGEELGEGYVNRNILRTRSPIRSTLHASSQNIEGSEVNTTISSDRWREFGQEERYFNREGILRSRSPIRDERHTNRSPLNVRPQEIEGDNKGSSISSDRWQEDDRQTENYVNSDILRSGFPIWYERSNVSGSSDARPQKVEGDNVSHSITSDRWREDERQAGSYFNSGILRTRSPMRVESSNVNRSISYIRPQEIEEDNVSHSLSSNKWREGEEQLGRYVNRGILGSKSPMRDERSNVRDLQEIEGNNMSHSVFSDGWQEDERLTENYVNNGVSRSRLPMQYERSNVSGPSDARPQKVEGDNLSHSIFSDRWREGERQAGSYYNRDILRTRSPMGDESSNVNRGISYVRQQETAEDNVSHGVSSDKWREEEQLGRYVNKGALGSRSPKWDERSTVNKELSGVRPQEIEGDKVSDISSDRWQKNEEQVGRYINKGNEGYNINRNPLAAGPLQVEGETVNRGTLRIRSPVQGKERNLNRISSDATPPVLWESSYIDRSTTGHGEKNKEVNIKKVAPTVILPAEKEIIGRGLRSEESTESYLNKDSPSARPHDVNYSNKIAPAANPRDFNEGSYLNTTPNETLPGRCEGSYFNRSISSTRLLGSGLGSLINLSVASRPFTSYPSCATTAKPLGLNSGNYFFNRGLSHNRLREYNEKNRGVSGDMNLRKGQEPTMNNYHAGLSTVKHQGHSYREICTRCYAVGHKSVDCPQLRT